ncbi:hypothetical protein [uncultured Megamonas sp.]|uniref:phage upper tail fiber protein n=1 Tax=uncultured Megamonas sp. TaxID=286140 RepID=UPI00259BAAEF|nr:hypothetical protein [uncultured Megamonas sp.]
MADNTNPCCKCTTPQYTIQLNTQGPPGKQGTQGIPGVSPVVTVAVQSDTTYRLNITDANGTIETPNLQGRGVPRGGEIGDILVKTGSGDFDATWQDAYQNMPLATATTPGVVRPDNVTTTVSGGILSAHLAVNFQEPLSMAYKYYGVPEFVSIYDGAMYFNNLSQTIGPLAASSIPYNATKGYISISESYVDVENQSWILPVDSGRSYTVVRTFNSGDTLRTPLTMSDLSQPYRSCYVFGNYNNNTGRFIPKIIYIPITISSVDVNTGGTNPVNVTNYARHTLLKVNTVSPLNVSVIYREASPNAGTYLLNNIQLTSIDENTTKIRLFDDTQTSVHEEELDVSFQSLNINAVIMNFSGKSSFPPGSIPTAYNQCINADELYMTNGIGETVWEVNYSTANTEVVLDIGKGLTLDENGKLTANIDNNTITFNSSGQMVAQGGGGGGSAPSNMVTTDTAQTISGAKTFTGNIVLNGGQILAGTNAIINGTSSSLSIGNTNLPLTLYGSTIQDEDNHPILSAGNLANYLVAGTNVSLSTGSDGKVTINSTGGGTGGTTDYTQLSNKPQINNVELSGNKTLSELGIQPDTGFKFWSGTQTEYDGITTKDNNTLYFITGT